MPLVTTNGRLTKATTISIETTPEELEQKESKKEAAQVDIEENPVKNLKAEESKVLDEPILKD